MAWDRLNGLLTRTTTSITTAALWPLGLRLAATSSLKFLEWAMLALGPRSDTPRLLVQVATTTALGTTFALRRRRGCISTISRTPHRDWSSPPVDLNSRLLQAAPLVTTLPIQMQ